MRVVGRLLIAWPLVQAVAGCGAPGVEPAAPAFDQDALPDAGIGQIEATDPAAWRVASEGGRAVLELFVQSDYQPPFRSPHNIALLGDEAYGDFTLDVEARQTGREYGHRDLCLFFGWQSPERFYYAHLATTPDERAHNVFLVDGAARRNLLPAQEEGVDWGDGWHRLRVERSLEDGAIRVYFDDLEEPVLEVHDTTLGPGRVGLGSFDDTGRFAGARIISG